MVLIPVGLGTSGALSAIAGSPCGTGLAPDSIAVEAAGKFVYVANATMRPLLGFRSIDGAPFVTGPGPRAYYLA
jgi:DNA-binding beta-propeller fold protein YncE